MIIHLLAESHGIRFYFNFSSQLLSRTLSTPIVIELCTYGYLVLLFSFTQVTYLHTVYKVPLFCYLSTY